jgi:hypothetical protein
MNVVHPEIIQHMLGIICLCTGLGLVAHAHISHLMVCAVPTTARLAGRGLSPVRRSRLGLEDSQAPVILYRIIFIKFTAEVRGPRSGRSSRESGLAAGLSRV